MRSLCLAARGSAGTVPRGPRVRAGAAPPAVVPRAMVPLCHTVVCVYAGALRHAFVCLCSIDVCHLMTAPPVGICVQEPCPAPKSLRSFLGTRFSSGKVGAGPAAEVAVAAEGSSAAGAAEAAAAAALAAAESTAAAAAEAGAQDGGDFPALLIPDHTTIQPGGECLYSADQNARCCLEGRRVAGGTGYGDAVGGQLSIDPSRLAVR